MTTGNRANAKRFYSQLLLPGCGDFSQQANRNSDSSPNVNDEATTKEPNWEQKSYKVLVPVIIEQTGFDGTQYEYTIRVDANADLSVIPIGEAGKERPKQAFAMAKQKGKKGPRIPMVYGIHPEGKDSFSRPSGLNPVTGITDIFVNLLVGIDRAVRERVHQLQRGKDDNQGSSKKGTRAQKDLGADKA